MKLLNVWVHPTETNEYYFYIPYEPKYIVYDYNLISVGVSLLNHFPVNGFVKLDKQLTVLRTV